MAAGLGTRMRSKQAKHLHPLLGRRVVDWVFEAVAPLAPSPLAVVVSPETEDELRADLPEGATLALQADPRGTGDAVAAAREALAGFDGDILVLDGAAPLVTTELLRAFVDDHRAAAAAVSVLSIEPDEPFPYGRVLRGEDGSLRGIVEEPDATDEERAVRELNSSIYVFASAALWPALERLEAHNVQGELYLTDAVRLLVDEGRHGAVYRSPEAIAGLGVNNRAELAEAAAELRRRIVRDHMLAGVTIVDPATTWIEPAVEIESDAVIQPFTILKGATVVRSGAEVGPHAVVDGAEIGPGATVGPFCYLRPDTVLGETVRAGAFVEIKNSRIAERAKVPHLSYVGDADVGAGTNIAAGNIMANYPHEPGRPKQRTKIGKDVRTGVHNSFVAPVEVGDDAWIGAGSTITEDVPAGALAIARARQVNKERRGDGHRDD
jgi:bifunctional UDP-N-acetylglucosamine pyrophosphorylase/glucosamine-1-phosphate N-acetyltransferase